MNVLIIGASKVGRALTRPLRDAGHRVSLRSYRRGAPAAPIDADLVVLAVRDPVITQLARTLAECGAVRRSTTVLHVAGALGPDALAPLRGIAAGVGQAHPLVSFASPRHTPNLRGATLCLVGDASAVRKGKALARALGMVPRVFEDLDGTRYHAAAGLVANGSVALAAAGARLLELAGVPARDAPRALGPLLRSVAENVERLGLPHALTGPVRRGDADAVRAHMKTIGAVDSDILALYGQCVRAQVPLARALRDAPPAAFDAVARAAASRKPRRRK